MDARIPRFIIPNQVHGENVIVDAFSKVLALCKRSQFSKVSLLIPAKNNFPSDLEALVGSKDKNRLLRNETLNISQSVAMDLTTIKTFSSHLDYELLFGLYIDERGFDLLDSAYKAKAIVVFPWFESEATDWINRWNPQVLGENRQIGGQITLLPEVEEELNILTKMVNLSEGINHPSDKELAKRTFKSLKAKGLRFNATDIKNSAIQKGWKPKLAEQLAKLAKRYEN